MSGVPPAVRRYAVAVGIVAASGLVRLLLLPLVGNTVPFVLYYPSVTLSAWYGGLGPGLVTMGLSAVGAWAYFFSARGVLHLGIQSVATQFALFLLGGTLICALCESLHRATRRADETVTNLRRTESALRESEERLHGIIASATDAIITVDGAERVRLFSAGAEQVFGWRADEVIGQPLDRFLPARHRTVHHDHIREFARTGISMRAMGGERVLAGVRRSGEEFPIEARISQLDVNGENFYTVIIRDVTERQRAEREREDLLRRERTARAAAEDASRSKDDFLATVSHELRTPLSPILVWASMLRKRTLDAGKTDHALEVIERCARSQAQLIEDLLDVSRIIAGKFQLHLKPVDLGAVTAHALEAVRPAAELKGVHVEEAFEEGVGRLVGDPDRLQQAVWNLISNAVKFTPPGGRVRIALAVTGGEVELSVSDTGQGIPPQFLRRIFERFQQADTSPTRVHGGLGLGLAIVRHIVELHGGTVAAESAGEGRGAAFRVRLPRTGLRPARQDGPRAAPAPRPPALAGLRVLVVDDEPDTCEALREVLREAAADVRVATSSAAAVTVLSDWRPDVLVSDIGMPDEDGFGLVRRVRAGESGTGRRLPSIALTAYARDEDRTRALSSGFDVHVAKPVDPEELVSAVASLVEAFGRSSQG